MAPKREEGRVGHAYIGLRVRLVVGQRAVDVDRRGRWHFSFGVGHGEFAHPVIAQLPTVVEYPSRVDQANVLVASPFGLGLLNLHRPLSIHHTFNRRTRVIEQLTFSFIAATESSGETRTTRSCPSVNRTCRSNDS